MSAPWMKFYPTDWRADPSLRMCSLAARGLWMEMLCIMHEASPYGSMRVNGRPVTDRQLAALAGGEIDALLVELEEAGVFSREEDGTIYSRRMQRDAEKASRDKANGRKGGNPDIKRGVNPPDKAQKPDARYQKEDVVSDETTSPEPGKPAPVAVIGLPTVSDGDFSVFEADIAEWSTAFPSVDVRQQLAAMRQWLLANSTRRKTKRGMRKFVVSWLDRRQNAGPSQPSAQRATSPPGRRENAADALRAMRAENRHEPENRRSDCSDAELLPPDEPRLQAFVGHLGGTLRWPDGSGHH